MNRRNLFILLVVFVVLVVIAALQIQQSQSPTLPLGEETPTSSFLGRDLNLTVLDIQAIRLRDPNSDQEFVISRDVNGNWTAPESEGRLDTDAASNIARTVVLATYQQSIPITDTTDLTQYGFQPNGFFAVDVVRTNNEGHVIAVGGLVPNGTTYYALIDDQPRLYFLDRGAIEYLMVYLAQPPLT